MKTSPIPHVWRLVCAALLFTCAFGHAQEQYLNPYATLTTAEQIAEVVGQAHTEILLISPNLRSLVIAEALGGAITERGVSVFILTTIAGANEEASYLHALRLLGAHVRIMDLPEPAMIIDRTYLITGGLLKPAPRIGEPVGLTHFLSDEELLAVAANDFVRLYADALQFEFTLDRDAQ